MATEHDNSGVWALEATAHEPGWHVSPYDDAIAERPLAAGWLDRSVVQPGRDGGRGLRIAALVAAVAGLAALTAAACVLSYSGMHHLAIQAGVPVRLAKVYPLIFDALLVVTGCSVLALRGAGVISRVYGWLCMLVLLACLAAGGAVHAAAIKVPRHAAGVIAAIVPWALVLIGFGLLIALLRYARIRRNQAHGGPAAARQGVEPCSVADADAGAITGPAVDDPPFTRTHSTPTPPED